MKLDGKPPIIVVAEDDEDDRQWVKEALLESQAAHQAVFVNDGEELMDYLRHRGRYAALRRSSAKINTFLRPSLGPHCSV